MQYTGAEKWQMVRAKAVCKQACANDQPERRNVRCGRTCLMVPNRQLMRLEPGIVRAKQGGLAFGELLHAGGYGRGGWRCPSKHEMYWCGEQVSVYSEDLATCR